MHVYILSIHLLFTIHTLDAITTNYDSGVTDHDSRVVDGKSPLFAHCLCTLTALFLLRAQVLCNIALSKLYSFVPAIHHSYHLFQYKYTMCTCTRSSNSCGGQLAYPRCYVIITPK